MKQNKKKKFIQLRWWRFLREFRRKLKHRVHAGKIAKSAGVIGAAVICAG